MEDILIIISENLLDQSIKAPKLEQVVHSQSDHNLNYKLQIEANFRSSGFIL